MALNLTSRLQVTAHYFWNRRNAAALSHHGVRLEYDPEQRRSAALILGVMFTLLAMALMFVLSWFKPAGQVGQSAILADRDTGAVYVMVDGRLHPALNLMSARLIAGQPNNPTFVKAAELEKYPQGPLVGIVALPRRCPSVRRRPRTGPCATPHRHRRRRPRPPRNLWSRRSPAS